MALIESHSGCVALPTLRDARLAPGTIILEVIDGLHDGVRVALNGTNCVIGTDKHCDIVLADGDIAPKHVCLRFYGKQVSIDAIGGDIVIDGQPDLPSGQGLRLNLPTVLTIGKARLRIDRSNKTFGFLTRIPTVFMIGTCIVGLVALSIGASRLGVQDAYAATGQIQTPKPAPIMQSAVAYSAETAANELRERIAMNRLTALDVTQTGYHIEVTGTVAPEKTADWQKVQQWFDGTYGASYVLTSRIMPAAATRGPDFSFRAVWFGDAPYVVDETGQRRYPGAALRDGWMLRSIEPGLVRLSRNGVDFDLTLGPDTIHADAGSVTNK